MPEEGKEGEKLRMEKVPPVDVVVVVVVISATSGLMGKISDS